MIPLHRADRPSPSREVTACAVEMWDALIEMSLTAMMLTVAATLLAGLLLAGLLLG